jgi:hypothetical protein
MWCFLDWVQVLFIASGDLASFKMILFLVFVDYNLLWNSYVSCASILSLTNRLILFIILHNQWKILEILLSLERLHFLRAKLELAKQRHFNINFINKCV